VDTHRVHGEAIVEGVGSGRLPVTRRRYEVSRSFVSRLLARYQLRAIPLSSTVSAAAAVAVGHRRQGGRRILNLRVEFTARVLDAGSATIAWHLERQDIAV
jgi:hypothetical protein